VRCRPKGRSSAQARCRGTRKSKAVLRHRRALREVGKTWLMHGRLVGSG
jgi:hypothetical protein